MSNRDKAAERAARAAALRAEQERQERRRRLFTFGGVALALLVIVAVAVGLQLRAGDVDDTAAVPRGATESYGMSLGEAGADHEVVIYEDFICPACKGFEKSFDAELESAVADGRATVEYRPLNFLTQFGDYSERSANAFAVVLDAAGPEVAKEFHDILYAEQPPETGDHPDDAWLIEKAVEAGATEAQVSDGIVGLEFKGWVDNGVKAATSAGIKGTPTVIVDGEPVSDTELVEVLE